MTTAPVAPAASAPQYLEAVLEDTAVTDKGEVEGLALPFGEVLNRPHHSGATRQQYAGATVRASAQLYYGHDHQLGGMPIGRVLSGTKVDKGLRLRSRFAQTAKAAEVKALATPDEDGVAVLDRYSVGYFEVAGHLEDDGDLWVHDDVDVFEVSIVPLPAYDSAAIDTVLHRPTTTPDPTKNGPSTMTAAPPDVDLSTLATAEDVSTLSASIEDLTRKVATLSVGDQGGNSAPAVPGRSFGEFLQMVATPTHPQHTEAIGFLAYVGGTVADLGPLMKDTWVGDRYKLIEAQRDLVNFFSSSPLPASGMGVEYGVVGTDTTKVEEQVAEGDTLAYGKITFDTDTAKLKTYGGWGEMSFQQIQRSPIAVLERYFDALLRRYAQTTEAAVNAATLAAGTAIEVPLFGSMDGKPGPDDWTRFVIRAARRAKKSGYPIEGLLVGFDVFEDMALLRGQVGASPATGDTDHRTAPFLDRDTGTINIVGLRGQVYTLPVIPFESGLEVGVVRAANKQAIRTYEAAGAPFRLQDDDITKLTHAASVYGYMAVAEEVPEAILKPAWLEAP